MSTVVRGDLSKCFIGKTRYAGNHRENLPAKRHSSSKVWAWEMRSLRAEHRNSFPAVHSWRMSLEFPLFRTGNQGGQWSGCGGQDDGPSLVPLSVFGICDLSLYMEGKGDFTM